LEVAMVVIHAAMLAVVSLVSSFGQIDCQCDHYSGYLGPITDYDRAEPPFSDIHAGDTFIKGEGAPVEVSVTGNIQQTPCLPNRALVRVTQAGATTEQVLALHSSTTKWISNNSVWTVSGILDVEPLFKPGEGKVEVFFLSPTGTVSRPGVSSNSFLYIIPSTAQDFGRLALHRAARQWRAHDYAEAERTLDQARRLLGETDDVLSLKTLICRDTGRLQEDLAIARKLAARNPKRFGGGVWYVENLIQMEAERKKKCHGKQRDEKECRGHDKDDNGTDHDTEEGQHQHH
jgi:hypothetical protein